MNWIRVTNTENIPLREGRAVRIGGQEIALFNLGDRFVACENTCPHRGGPLADGIVAGATVVCPLHAYNVCLETGKVTKPNMCVKVDTYPVRVEDGVVMIALPKEQEKQLEGSGFHGALRRRIDGDGADQRARDRPRPFRRAQ